MRSILYAGRFWDRMAPKYDRGGGYPDRDHRRTLETIRRYLSPGQSVLDYGCGTGSYLCDLSDEGLRFTAIDISEEMLKIAEKKCMLRSMGQIRFLQGEIFTDSLEAGSFDLILACSILHLTPGPQRVVGRLHSLLRPGGMLISSTAALRSATAYGLLIRLLTGIGFIPSFNFFSSGSLTRLFEGAGFSILENIQTESSPLQYCIVCRKD